MRVVIADDSPVFRDQWAGFLQTLGHVVVGKGKDGREAVALCAIQKPDLVMLDMSMGSYGGDRAALDIRTAKTAKFILIASSLSSERTRAEAAGFAFITKPICNAETLRIKLAQVCGE